MADCPPHRRACGEAEIRNQIPEWLEMHGYAPGLGWELQVCVKCGDVLKVQLYQVTADDARIEQVIQRVTTKPHAAVYDGQYVATAANGNGKPVLPTPVAVALDDQEGDTVSTNLAGLKPKQPQVMTLLLEGYNISECSKQTGLIRETISDWLKSPGFKDALAQARQSVVDVVVARLTQASNKAVSTLIEILDDPDEEAKVKLQAASQVLMLMHRFTVEGERRGNLPGRNLHDVRDQQTGKFI